MQQYNMEITLHVLHKLKKIILKMIEPTSHLVFFFMHMTFKKVIRFLLILFK